MSARPTRRKSRIVRPEGQPQVGSTDWLGGLPMRVCPECGGGGCVADPLAIGGRMREMREKARLTLREVARRLGLSAMYICDLEHGRRGWNAERVTNYVAALRPPSAELCGGSEPSASASGSQSDFTKN